MATWLILIAVGFFLTLIAPIFLATSREARGCLAGMFGGVYISIASMAGIAYFLYAAAFHGVTAIGRRTTSATVSFSEQPLISAIVLLINVGGLACFTALGWLIFKSSRDDKVAP